MSIGDVLGPSSLARIVAVVLLWAVVSLGFVRSVTTALVGTGIVLLWAVWAVQYRLERNLRERYAFFPPDRNRVRRWTFPLGGALVTGLVSYGVTRYFHLHLGSYGSGLGGDALWVFGGMFVFGAVPGYFWGRYRVVSPVLVAVVVYGLALALSWSTLIQEAQSVDARLRVPTPFEWLLLFWPYVLVAVLVVGAWYGAVEYGRHSSRQL